jgi:CBS domain-containing protein
MNASEIMTNQPLSTCRPETTCQQAAQMMCDKNIGVIPVVDSANTVQGIITDRDICCQVTAPGKSASTPVSQIMSRDVHCVRPDASLEQVESVMRQFQVRRVPVVDSNRRLQGIISLANLSHACRNAGQDKQLCETLEAVCSAAAQPAATWER